MDDYYWGQWCFPARLKGSTILVVLPTTDEAGSHLSTRLSELFFLILRVVLTWETAGFVVQGETTVMGFKIWNLERLPSCGQLRNTRISPLGSTVSPIGFSGGMAD